MLSGIHKITCQLQCGYWKSGHVIAFDVYNLHTFSMLWKIEQAFLQLY